MIHIIDDGQALTLVRSESFRNHILRLAPKRHIMCYETVRDKWNESLQRMKTNLQKALSQTKFVLVTADGWSRRRKSFIGLTAHWIDSELKRRSIALACHRIIDRHTYDVIAEKMEDVLVEFSIHNKTTGATTDNGSNFVKAFTWFSHENEFVDVDARVVNIAIDEELSFLSSLIIFLLEEMRFITFLLILSVLHILLIRL